MIRVTFLSLCLNLLTRSYSIAQDSLQVSLLTCSPGTELYSIFGHSAVRIKNLNTGKDEVYNYGTFSFSDQNFYLKFLRGKLNYYLTRTSFDRFMYEYTLENRSVYEQVFNLNTEQKLKLITDLKTNALPENRAYKYDFFWDNCSTRIRDIIYNQFKSNLSYPDFKPKPFRSYLHDCLVKMPWSKFGIDLILGLPCDEIVGTKEAMFLPLQMMKAYDSTTVNTKAISSHSTEILSSINHSEIKSFFLTPFIVSLLILFITIVSVYFKQNFWPNLAFILTGLAGCIIFFLWFLSDHITTKNNLHFIWANPVVFLYPFRFKLFKPRLVKWLSRIYFTLLLFLILFFPINFQQMPAACIPIWIALGYIVFQDIK